MAADPLRWVDDELAALDTAGLRRRRTVREGPQGAGPIHWNGRDLVNFGSNDYLGLAAAEVRDAVLLTIERAGWGSGASPLVTGRGAVHEALEQALARFEGTQAALLFSSGYAANLSTLASSMAAVFRARGWKSTPTATQRSCSGGLLGEMTFDGG